MDYMYGLECEFELKSSEKLLSFYKPEEIAPEQWLELSFAEQLKQLSTLKATVKNRTPWLKLIKSDRPDLPSHLIKDDTGNLELVYAPVLQQSRLEAQIEYNQEQFGPHGMFQATVSLPATDFFDQDHRSLLGWFQFQNEKDFLEKLHYSAIKNRTLAEPRSHWGFIEPFLGPLTDYKANRLRKALKYQAKGEWWTPEALDFLSLNASSSKYVGSTVYRPDLAGPDRICLEIRDAHKNTKLLKQRVERIKHYFPGDLSLFKTFNTCPQVSYDQDFERLPIPVQDLLRKQISHQVPSGLEKFSRVAEVYEVYRRWAYPLRDWAPWLEQLGAESQAHEAVDEAVVSYTERLNQLAESPHVTASALIGTLMDFVEQSQLYSLFQGWESAHSPLIK